MRIISIVLFCLLVISGGNVYCQFGRISGAVMDEFGPLPGSSVELIGISTLNTSCDADGKFSFDVGPGNYKVRVSSLMYRPQEQEVTITFINLDSKLIFKLEPGSALDEYISIGSRSEPRSQLETTVPVDVISPMDLDAVGQVSVSQKLQYIAPSFHSTRQTISDGTDHIDVMSLRGLGPDQVLVLVNGKRRHTSSLVNVNGTVGRGSVGTDLNTIPVSAIKKIEILRDGAAAQYGSDAIAGVINVVLKDGVELAMMDVTASPTLAGDGFQTLFNANSGFKVGEKGSINVTAEIRHTDKVNRSGNYTGNVYTSDDVQDQILIEENAFYNELEYDDQRVMEIGNAKTIDFSTFFNAVFPFKKGTEIYANGGYNHRIGQSRAFYRFPIDENKVVEELYPNGFSPELKTAIDDKSIAVGVRSNVRNWMIDFSYSSGSNKLDFDVNNSNNASLGTQSPNSFYSGGFEYRQNITNVDISRTIESLWFLKSINAAFGGDVRLESYKINAGEESSWIDGGDTTSTGGVTGAGAQSFPGFQPQNVLNKSRVNFAGYADVEANFTKKLLVGLETRAVNYSDFGGNFSWKLATRYRLMKNLSLRASYSTGFRAPSLQQIYFNNIGTQFVGGSAFQVGTFNNQSSVTKAFGIASLKPESSQNISGGITTKLFKNFILTLDGYFITIDNRIVLSGRFDDGFESILNPLGVGAAQFFTNGINTQTRGLDAVLGYEFNIGKGLMNLSGMLNLTDTKVIGGIARPEVLAGKEDELFNREEISRIENAQPDSKFISLATYKYSKLTFLLRATRFGKVKYIHPEDGDQLNWVLNEFTGNIESRDQTFTAKWVTDLSVNYKLSNNVGLTVGANNLFNVYPDRHTHSSNVSLGRFVYSRRVQQFGVTGASYFVKLRIRL